MSTQRTGIRLLLTLAVCALLGACAVEPSKPVPTPATVIARPPPPSTTVAPIAPAIASNEPWASIVSSDAMQDCTDSPIVRANAAMYTRSPARFSAQLKQALPLIMYVHRQLQAAGIPGEFVMLPMLESSYDPAISGRRGRPAGMWQLMPQTARLHGVATGAEYDGRLDPIASTQAAVRMLVSLKHQFGDWRLVAMAYNSGAYTVAAALRRHPKLGDGAIPDIPASWDTRTHLARMLALSCIVRDPERFRVTLPRATAADELQAVRIPAGTRLQAVASMAGVTEVKLHRLNPGYIGARVPTGSPRKLLLPADAAETLAAALALRNSESVAEVDPSANGAPRSDGIALPAEPVLPQAIVTSSPAPTPTPTDFRVRRGDTLYSIAHHYHVSVRDLMRWNGLHNDTLRPGEELRIRG